MGTGNGLNVSAPKQCNGQGIYKGKSAAFTGNLKPETSRQYRRRHRRYRRYRRSRSIFEKKKDQCKKANVSHGEQRMNNKLRRGELPFVRRRRRRSRDRRSRRS
ncbi:hypothetical protein [Absidia glauca]|uniref:Uncharacterized protein n=1 Tax=Absidia glauca TaxID=4829 RepID=A0A168P9D4_ABSGL|nr:hypothetical protein [Absidia glauca]